MTGYTVHTGSTEKFAAGWDAIFRKGTAKPKKKAAKASKPKAASRKKGRK